MRCNKITKEDMYLLLTNKEYLGYVLLSFFLVLAFFLLIIK